MKIIVKNDLAKMFQEYSQKFFLGEEENEQRYPLARHILHICIDGLRPDCMPYATSGMPNMLDRLAYQGTYTRVRTVLWYWNPVMTKQITVCFECLRFRLSLSVNSRMTCV